MLGVRGAQPRARPGRGRQDDRSPKGCAPRRFTAAQRDMLLDLVARVGRHHRRRGGGGEDGGGRGEPRRHLFRVGRPDDQRQGRVLPDPGADGRSSNTRRKGRATRTSITSTRSIAIRPTTTRRRRAADESASVVGAIAACWPGLAPPAAHELDEYLQASRVSLARDHVAV